MDFVFYVSSEVQKRVWTLKNPKKKLMGQIHS